jgi:hypothetical protein
MSRNNLVLGFILLLLGGLMLADAAGYRLPGGASPMDFFWPILLILAGLTMVFNVFVRSSRKVEVEKASIDLQGAGEARLKISHGAGKLKIHSGAARGVLASGSFAGGLRQTVRKTGDKLEVRMRPAADTWGIPFLGPGVPLDWDLSLNADVALDLDLDSGANEADINLRDLRVTNLNLDSGASETKLTLPARGRLRADLDIGAASMDITIPDGVAARIKIDHGVSDVKVDARFPRVGGVYKSTDFESAANAVDLNIDAGAAQIRIH